MRRYIVEISYIKFQFETMCAASAFADEAFDALADNRTVSITIKEDHDKEVLTDE